MIEAAWVRKNAPQLSRARAPAGGTPGSRRIFATLVAETRTPTAANSPMIRWQLGAGSRAQGAAPAPGCLLAPTAGPAAVRRTSIVSEQGGGARQAAPPGERRTTTGLHHAAADWPLPKTPGPSHPAAGEPPGGAEPRAHGAAPRSRVP